MVFTTFLILFGSGMVVQNVVWYWYGFDCLIPEGSRNLGIPGYDMGSCVNVKVMFARFRFAGSAPHRSHSTSLAKRSNGLSERHATIFQPQPHCWTGQESRTHWRDGCCQRYGKRSERRRAQPAAGSPRASSSVAKSTLAVALQQLRHENGPRL